MPIVRGGIGFHPVIERTAMTITGWKPMPPFAPILPIGWLNIRHSFLLPRA